MRTSGFLLNFPAIAYSSAHVLQGRKNTAIAEKREENPEILTIWYSAKRAGVKRACPNKVMAHLWFMHDAHLGHAFLFLDMLAE